MNGGYKCSCPPGYQLKSDGYTCKLVAKKLQTACTTARRPKFGFLRCNRRKDKGRYPIGTKCKVRCRRGYQPDTPYPKVKCDSSAQWTGPDVQCIPLQCPAIPALPNGKVEPESCMSKLGVPVGQRCDFSCDSGFTLTGQESTKCARSQRWKNMTAMPICSSDFPKPFIICPADVTKPLPSGKASSVYVMFSQPKTNVDWFR